VPFEKRLSFVSSGCKWLSLVSSGCKWLSLVSSGCKWLSLVSSGWLSFRSCVSSVRSCVSSVSKGGGYMHVRSCVCSVSIHTHRTRDKLCLQCQPLLELTTALLSFNSLPLSARLSINAQKHAHTFVPASHSTHKHTHTLLCQPLIQRTNTRIHFCASLSFKCRFTFTALRRA
jgi:hypothetical protein